MGMLRAPVTAAVRHHPMSTGAFATIPGTFGDNSFNDRAMKRYLSKEVYNEFQACLDARKPVSTELANHFAQGLLRYVTVWISFFVVAIHPFRSSHTHAIVLLK